MMELDIYNYSVSGIYNAIYDSISQKSDTKYIINHIFSRIRIDSYNYLPIEKQ